jgi:hypothetical protein
MAEYEAEKQKDSINIEAFKEAVIKIREQWLIAIKKAPISRNGKIELDEKPYIEEMAKLIAFKNHIITNNPKSSDTQQMGDYIESFINNAAYQTTKIFGNLADLGETVVTLGNGRFFNNNGETTWNHKWYNWGMQDLLPTWRWWIDNGDGKTVPTDAIQIDFTYDDAWFGGSCLKLHGATNRSDVRLFATRWNVASTDDYFRVIYKVNSGTDSHLKLMVAKDGETADFKTIALPAGEQGEWATALVKASDFGFNTGDVIGYVGLSAEQTPANYEVLLGEMAFIPSDFAVTPNTPAITYSEVMKRYYNRADFKVVFDMGTPATRPEKYEGCPVYNEEVGAWYYEVYVKQGDKETLVTTTTSWAAYVVDAPLDPSIPNL